MSEATTAAGDPRTARTVGELLTRRAAQTPEKPVFVPLGRDGAGAPVTYGALLTRAGNVAAALRMRARRGERVVLVFPNEPAFLDAFLGCLLAGLVAVPMAVPRNTRGMERLLAVSHAAGAVLGIMAPSMTGRMAKLGADRAGFEWIDLDGMLASAPARTQLPRLDPDDVAVLQFTSGSTGMPKAVMVRHANILHNCRMLQSVCGAGDEMRMVSWLPFFHDWGLFGCLLFPIFTGGLSHFMDPGDFLRRPLFWIEMIAATGARVSCAPDFAYAQAAREAAGTDLSGLDLTGWRLAMMGAEPVRPDTMRAFTAAFARYGFRSAALFPSYGLAESTLIVSGGDPEAEPVLRRYDRKALQSGHADPALGQEGAQEIAGVGHALLDQRVAIVDPDTGRPCPERRIGEIWVSGPSVTAGYMDRPEETEAAFEAHLPGDPADWLRTGDLGFVDGGELFVCGRLKEVIIKAGVNYMAEDLEHSVAQAHPALRAGAGAAFGVEAGGAERLVIAFEIDYGPRPDLDQVVGAIQKAVQSGHDVFSDAILILRPGTLEKTSSGKIRRRKAAEDFLLDRLAPLKAWTSWTGS